MTAELSSIIDFIRYGASAFGRAGLTFGHSFDNALDESTQLVLHALHLLQLDSTRFLWFHQCVLKDRPLRLRQGTFCEI